MKKGTLVFTGLMLLVSSCRRTSYTCFCSQGIGGASYQKEVVYSGGSKKKANRECESKASAGESCYPVFAI